MTPQVKAHLSVILALMALVKTVQYYLARFELNFSTRGVVEGASYTDVHAQLPALNLLMVISVVAAGAVHLEHLAAGLGASRSSRSGCGASSRSSSARSSRPCIQQFFVQPNELAKEQPYIERNIEATRDAFGLDDKHVAVEQLRLQGRTSPPQTSSSDSQTTRQRAALGPAGHPAATSRCSRSCRPSTSSPTSTSTATRSTASTRQVLIAARELNRDDLPEPDAG